jgi:hypothetical protein
MISIDISKLDEKQLTALALIDPEAVKGELLRRKAYPTLTEGVTELRQAHLDLSVLLDNTSNRKTAKAVRDTGIVAIIDRLLVTSGFPKGMEPVLRPPVIPPSEDAEVAS